MSIVEIRNNINWSTLFVENFKPYKRTPQGLKSCPICFNVSFNGLFIITDSVVRHRFVERNRFRDFRKKSLVIL